MAYADNEQYDSASSNPYPRIAPTRVLPCTFGADAAAPTLAVGTPVAFDENNLVWVQWSAAGTGNNDEIRGFVYPDAIALDDAGEVIGQVMVKGDIHFSDIVLPDGEAASDLREAVRTQCLSRDLVVRGISKVR
jgi:hypothetical protein